MEKTIGEELQKKLFDEKKLKQSSPHKGFGARFSPGA